MVEHITPTVMIDGEAVAFEGWMFVLAYALKGIPWAIEKVESEEFDMHGKIKDYYHRKEQYYVKNEIERIEKRLAALRSKLE